MKINVNAFSVNQLVRLVVPIKVEIHKQKNTIKKDCKNLLFLKWIPSGEDAVEKNINYFFLLNADASISIFSSK